ncbi:MAG: toll/interleukin-1 receptor domain-containing protein [Promethearchaeota archaeon]
MDDIEIKKIIENIKRELDDNILLADEGMLTLENTKKIFKEINGKIRNILPHNSIPYLKYDSLMSKRTAWWTEDERTGKYISKGGSNYQNLVYLQEAIGEALKKIKVANNITNSNQENSKIEENNKESKIFLSYSHKNKETADRVDKFFISKGIQLTRDERDAPAYSNLEKFMDTIRDHDYVIILISDAYLKSINCMYEVIQFIQERNYIYRTFPIVIDNEATIFDSSKHGKYINYWQEKYKKFEDEIEALNHTGTSCLHKELDKIDKIQSNIGEFLNKISKLKCLPLEELENTDYKAILDKISKTVGVFQKEKKEVESKELRSAFNLTNNRTEKIRIFREERISKIFSNETPLPFNDVAKIVLHLVPIISLNSDKRYDLKKISITPSKLPPLNNNGFTHKYDLEGFLTYSNYEMGKTYSYVKLYNNGILEVVEGKYLNPKQNDGNLIIYGSAYENALIESLPTYLSALKVLGVELPIFVLLTLVGVRGYSMFVGEKNFNIPGNTGINRDNLFIPEVIIENYPVAPEEVLKPCFDALWNAFGFPGSPNYDNTGKRKR